MRIPYYEQRWSWWPTLASQAPVARRVVLRSGAGLLVASLPAIVPEPAAATTQRGWRFCTKCRGLFLPRGSPSRKKKHKKGRSSLGVCPAGGQHAPRLDVEYVLQRVGPVVDLHLFKNFQQCQKCRGLFANDLGETGVCPAGGAHAAEDVFFELWDGPTIPGMDDAWDQCLKCSGVFNYAGGNAGSCPAGGGHQRADAGSRYTLFTLS